jgi:hypothetical protein
MLTADQPTGADLAADLIAGMQASYQLNHDFLLMQVRLAQFIIADCDPVKCSRRPSSVAQTDRK